MSESRGRDSQSASNRGTTSLPTGDRFQLSFLNLVVLRDNERAVVLTPGLDQAFSHLAKRYPFVQVYAFEKDPGRLGLLMEIKERKSIGNLHLIQADLEHLPAKQGVFTLVVAMAGSSRKDLGALLGQAWNLLAKGGKIVLGGNNKYSYRSLSLTKGRGSLGGDTRGWGREKYLSSLREAGFRSPTIYAAFPSHDSAKYISSLNGVRDMLKAVKLKGPKRILAMLPGPTARLLVPSFFIVAVK